MIEESYVSFETAKMLKEAGFDVPCRGGYHVNRFRYEAPTQALVAIENKIPEVAGINTGGEGNDTSHPVKRQDNKSCERSNAG